MSDGKIAPAVSGLADLRALSEAATAERERIIKIIEDKICMNLGDEEASFSWEIAASCADAILVSRTTETVEAIDKSKINS